MVMSQRIIISDQQAKEPEVFFWTTMGAFSCKWDKGIQLTTNKGVPFQGLWLTSISFPCRTKIYHRHTELNVWILRPHIHSAAGWERGPLIPQTPRAETTPLLVLKALKKRLRLCLVPFMDSPLLKLDVWLPIMKCSSRGELVGQFSDLHFAFVSQV